MRHVTTDEVIDLLTDAIKDRGEDWIYPTGRLTKRYKADSDELKTDDFLWGQETATCHYFATERDARILHVAEDAPLCIVGWVLDALDVTPRILKDLGVDQRGTGFAYVNSALYDNRLMTFDEVGRSILEYVQSEQDGGVNWGQSVKTALWVMGLAPDTSAGSDEE